MSSSASFPLGKSAGASDIVLWTGSHAPDTTFTLDEFFNDTDVNFRIYGVGVVADSGVATVASISFGEDTYNFAAPVTPGDPGTPGAPSAPTAPQAIETAAK